MGRTGGGRRAKRCEIARPSQWPRSWVVLLLGFLRRITSPDLELVTDRAVVEHGEFRRFGVVGHPDRGVLRTFVSRVIGQVGVFQG